MLRSAARLLILLSAAVHPSIVEAFAPSSRRPTDIRLYSVAPEPPKDKTVEKLPYGETSRRFRRTYYTHEDWVSHRNSDRFVSNLLKSFQSGIVRQLTAEIGLVSSIAVSVCLYNALFVVGYEDFQGVLHPALVNNLPLVALPLQPFTLSSPALALLLVFRTNSSFGRWTEGRKAWGAIVNHSRNIVRLASGWMTEDIDEETRKKHLERLADTVWAFSRSLQYHLRGKVEDEEDYLRDIQEKLSPAMAQALIDARHKPTRAMYELTTTINALPMTYFRRLELDHSVVALCDAMGGCERIFSSPVPLVYTRHTARFLGFFTLALPVALWNAFEASWNHLGLLPASILISFFFFGIEELAIQLEEPFGILPLEKLVAGIRLSADEAVEWHFEEESSKMRQLTEPDSFAVQKVEQMMERNGEVDIY
mmetsp:Transcript_17879/g.29585  ORF Transcript_17879/g.29585 Transcript_17879/m.29585 type:complete len:423 (+) Transcript_17879:128-1396(+)|eukprot:CAMPEP_0119002880 /NCGR_PEP_ID=MMETSP1176-20130426/197_1 /TAXON_ID=265551 /ORGANISM="Synedropsis recta cf, Strain CCMP1620" /LENGTH=422 /DNA_ID=CAMNT_0006954415 /DNA_START=60 /DNA_END=1328 /DNA_ORIENTATION=-